jgi:hypothetical protein
MLLRFPAPSSALSRVKQQQQQGMELERIAVVTNAGLALFKLKTNICFSPNYNLQEGCILTISFILLVHVLLPHHKSTNKRGFSAVFHIRIY